MTTRATTRATTRSTTRGINAAIGSVITPPAWTPASLANLRQWLSDNYYASPVSGLQVIESLESHGTVRAPQPGACALFDGVNDYGYLGVDPIPLMASGAITAWIEPNGGSALQFLVSCRDPDRIYFGLSASNEIYITLGSTNFTNTGVTETTRTHVAVRWNGGTFWVYRNGVQIYTGAYSGSTGGTSSCIGAYSASGNNASNNYFKECVHDLRIYNAVKSEAELLAIYNTDFSNPDTTGLWAGWYFNDRAGVVARDWSGNGRDLALTGPITESTFWAEDSSITANPANVLGYTLSGSTVIPRDESDITKDVQGNALQYTGLSPYPATIETPCITLDGVNDYVDLGNVSMSPTTISIVLKLASDDQEIMTLQNSTATAVTVAAGVLTFGGSLTVSAISVDGAVVSAAAAGALLNDNNWHTLSLTLTAISCSALRIGTDSSGFGAISVCELELTASGATKTFPFQEGPGTAVDNVKVYWYKTDGTYGAVASALVGVTVASAWANRCPGYVRDHAFEHGGRLDALGAFCPLVPGTLLCADGNAATLSAGKRGNPHSKMIPSPFDAAELNKFGFTSATRIDSDETFDDASSIADTGFGRIGADGIDREFLADEALTGADLAAAQAYIA